MHMDTKKHVHSKSTMINLEINVYVDVTTIQPEVTYVDTAMFPPGMAGMHAHAAKQYACACR